MPAAQADLTADSVASRQPSGTAVEVREPWSADASFEQEEPGDEESFENAAPATARAPGENRSGDDVGPDNRPSLDELVARVPPQTREALEQLFRLKFVGVRKIRTEDLR